MLELTPLLSRISKTWLCGITLWVGLSAAWAGPVDSFCFADQQCVHIKKTGRTLKLETWPGKQPLHVDAKARAMLKTAWEWRFVPGTQVQQGGEPLALAEVTLPSNTTRPSGYCGAGSEDYLVLVSLKKNALQVHDSLLVESCIQTLTLMANNTEKPFKTAPAPWLLSFVRTQVTREEEAPGQKQAQKPEQARLELASSESLSAEEARLQYFRFFVGLEGKKIVFKQELISQEEALKE